MDRPNILWICTDQQRFDTLGCYGNPWVRPPHIDRLAAEGTRFVAASCRNPLCTPSRASFLTGRYPRTTRARQNGQSIPADAVLVTRLLADAGYTCGLSGKLHLSACAPDVSPATERRIDDGYAEFHWSHHPDVSVRHNSSGSAGLAPGVLAESHHPDVSVRHNSSGLAPDLRPPFPPEVRAALRRSFREDTLKLQDLLGRDLSGWLGDTPSLGPVPSGAPIDIPATMAPVETIGAGPPAP